MIFYLSGTGRSLHKHILIGIILFCGMTQSLMGQNDFEQAVRNTVLRQIEVYPESTLKDLYKNFFQDEFGPGHIVSDTTAAGNYLRRELDSYSGIAGEIAEPLGWKNNFYRVNLSLIKTGQVPYTVYFDAFVRSVNSITPMPVSEWKKEWGRIEAVICSMGLTLPGFETDKKEIDARLESGEYVGHHSKAYEETYNPHYRIMSRDIFEKEILPLLPKP